MAESQPIDAETEDENGNFVDELIEVGEYSAAIEEGGEVVLDVAAGSPPDRYEEDTRTHFVVYEVGDGYVVRYESWADDIYEYTDEMSVPAEVAADWLTTYNCDEVDVMVDDEFGELAREIESVVLASRHEH